MKKSLGNKRKFINDKQREKLLKLYMNFQNEKHSKIYDNEFFGYTKLAIEQPLLDEKGNIIKDKKGNPKPNPKLRDYERVPLLSADGKKQNTSEYFKKEIKTHLPNAWINTDKNTIGYEINFTKYFYEYKPLRSLEEIKKDLMELEKKSKKLFKKIV